MTKKCPKCDLTLDESEYNWKIKGKYLATYCKKCSRAYVKNHYKSHTKYYIEKAAKRRLELQSLGFEFISSYLKTHPCIECGETDIEVLEFDHKNRDYKKTEIAKMLHSGTLINKLEFEMSKCEIRCANCHRRKTNRENQSWKLKYL